MKILFYRFFIWSIISGLCGSSLRIQVNNPLELRTNNGNKISLKQHLDDYLETYEKTGDFSGCVGIYKDGQQWYQNCFGKADYAFDLAHTNLSKFKIGSISKQMTAAAILRLEELGRLHTTDTINQYFPAIKIPAKITIHQLLTHTSGVPDIYELSDFKCRFNSVSSLIKLISPLLSDTLNFAPGSRYQYSNGGYVVLAGIIEKVSKMDYGQFLEQEIFRPLKMVHSGHYKTNEVVPNLSIGYDPRDYDDVIHSEWINEDLLKGAGSIYSTIDDLELWISSISERSLLSHASYSKLLADYGNRYGYGLSIYQSGGEKVFGNDGRISGYIADYLHYQEDHVSIIILGNIQTGVADFLRSDLRALMKGEIRKSKAKNQPQADHTDSQKIGKTGRYGFGPNLRVKVVLRGGKLFAQANEGGYTELVYLDNGQYFSRTLYATIDFIREKPDAPWKMHWINNEGRTFEGLKL